MVSLKPSAWFLLVPFFFDQAAGASNQTCKAVPGAANWPTVATWNTFNKTLNGVLLAPHPPALVCDKSRAQTYDEQLCDDVSSNWQYSAFHADDPVSIDWPNWQDDGCLPYGWYNGSSVCNLAPFPRYVVNASTANHVAATVKFASQNNVRLSVKGTGHDFLGR